MSTGSTLPYKLRPNKAVDRELFLSLLSRLCGTLPIEDYRYIGLGGPFLEDFRLLHARLGISDMKCIEMEKGTHLRQKFNRPFDSIECIHKEMGAYLDETEFSGPVILWLDYTTPGELKEQIDCFCVQVATLPVGSVVRITLNANPGSLGSFDNSQALNDDRITELRARLGNYVPSDFPPEYARRTKYGQGLLKILQMALDRNMEGYPDRKAIWALGTHYADGQPMATATVVVATKVDVIITPVVESWPFYSTPESPHVLELPALSTRERLTLEAAVDPMHCLEYALPVSILNQDPLKNFKEFYRVYPQFARVDL